MNEAQFTRAVIELAQWNRWRITHFRSARMQSGRWATPVQGDVGFPDLVLARNGEVLLVELKTETGRLGKGQQEWADAIGAQYRLWRPSMLEQIRKELR